MPRNERNLWITKTGDGKKLETQKPTSEKIQNNHKKQQEMTEKKSKIRKQNKVNQQDWKIKKAKPH